MHLNKSSTLSREISITLSMKRVYRGSSLMRMKTSMFLKMMDSNFITSLWTQSWNSSNSNACSSIKAMGIWKQQRKICFLGKFRKRHLSIGSDKNLLLFGISSPNRQTGWKAWLKSSNWLNSKSIGSRTKWRILPTMWYHQIRRIVIYVLIRYGWNTKYKSKLINWKNIFLNLLKGFKKSHRKLY